MANSVWGSIPANSEAKSTFLVELVRIILLTALGVGIKLAADRFLYKIEKSAGDSLSSVIFKPKRYGNSESNSVHNQSSYGGNNSGSLFNNNNYNSSWNDNNPFR